MRRMICVAALALLACNAVLAEKPKVTTLAKQVITRENERLTKAVQSTKAFMEMARLTSARAKELSNSTRRMESTVAGYNLILKGDQAELVITIARAIVHGDLERHYGEEQKRKGPGKAAKESIEQTRKRERSLLAELKILEEWQNKAIDRVKK